MRTLISFLSVLLCVAPFGVANAVVSSTVGNNLTAYNGESGATNNNRWNTLMNSRSVSTSTDATADFGNCNAVIMRCAQPKCSNGGCTDMSVTAAIVSGCVQSNSACKQYGDELVQYISAQLIANSTAKANAAANQAQIAAANAAAQQSAQQMAAMQAQMQQMQADMAAQNAQTVAQLQSALDEQKQLTANAIAEATAARETAPIAQTAQPVQSNSDSGNNGLTGAQLAAAQSGVSADILAREQISGQIMSSIENAEVQLKTLKTTMNDVFTYAGCDSRGNNCTGPKRVKMFKQKAEAFFDPYESVLDELYDALILAQSVGVDITDIYMMLNGTCNAWAQYLCTNGQVMHYTNLNCQEGKSLTVYADGRARQNETSDEVSRYTGLRGGANCVVGQVVPMSDGGCQLVKMLTSSDEVQRNWLYPEDGDDAHVRVGCASEALDNSALFRNRKKQATIDIETLQRIIAQDSPQSFGRTFGGKVMTAEEDALKYCSISQEGYAELQKATELKTLPKTVCVTNLDKGRTSKTKFEYTNNDCDANCEKCKRIIGGEWLRALKMCSCNDNLDDTDTYNACAIKASEINNANKVEQGINNYKSNSALFNGNVSVDSAVEYNKKDNEKYQMKIRTFGTSSGTRQNNTTPDFSQYSNMGLDVNKYTNK